MNKTVIENMKDAIDIAYSNVSFASLVDSAYTNRIKDHITEETIDEYLLHLKFLNKYLAEKLVDIYSELSDKSKDSQEGEADE